MSWDCERSRYCEYDHAVEPDGVQLVTNRIVSRWRLLTGGSSVRDPDRPTLVALSGGPDSSALLIALSAVKPARIVAAHIRHGLRPNHLQTQDSGTARALADHLGIEYHESDIEVPSSKNAEAGARRQRYDRLAAIAQDTGCHFVATGHHAQDQLETLLMALIRGTGLAGLAGIAESRKLTDTTTLIRPALTSTRQELEAVCESIGWKPAHDETNDDLARQRAWMRARILPELLERADDGLPERLLSASLLVRQAQRVVENHAAKIASHATESSNALCVSLHLIAHEEPIIIGEVIRQLATTLVGDSGADARGHKHLQPIIEVVRTGSMHAKTFDLRGIQIKVTNTQLTIRVHSPDMKAVTSRTSRSTSDGSPEL